MDLSQLLLFAALMVPFIAAAEISKLAFTATAPADRKLSVSITLGSWRPWFYALGIVGLIGCAYVDMPWRAVVYATALVAIVLLSAIFALRAKPRATVEDEAR